MDLATLLERHKERKASGYAMLRRKEYREHYLLVRDAVKSGVPLGTVLRILADDEGAFATKGIDAAWAAFKRALRSEGIVLSGK